MTLVSPLGSILFFYVFFVVLMIVMAYGLWEMHQERLAQMPSPLSAVLSHIPESINLFDDTEAVLRVKNCGSVRLKKVKVLWGNIWTFPLEPGAYKDIPLKLDTMYAGKHHIKAHIYCKQWELHIAGSYRVFQRRISPKEKYLKILGLRPGATRREIRRARNRLAKKYHPDLEEGSEEKMKEINEAYRRLMAP